jgi:Pvc16 N-terminal domain
MWRAACQSAIQHCPIGQRGMPPRRFSDGWYAATRLTRLVGVIHEVDSALRALIDREAGIRDVEVVFDAPTRDWASRRTTPTVDVYLYDIREDLRRRERGVLNEYNEDETRIIGRHLPPRHFKLSYLVTAWTQRPEDEHRLLSALLGAFIRYDAMPADLLSGPLAELGLPVPLTVGLPPPEDRGFADVWSALGGELKPSIDVVVSAPINTGQHFEVGPPVTTPPLFNFGGSRDVPVSEPVGLTSVEREQAAAAEASGKPEGAGRAKRAAAAQPAPKSRRAGSAARRAERAAEPEDSGVPDRTEAPEETRWPARTGVREREPQVDERAGVPAQTIRGPSSGGASRVSMRRRVMSKRTS